MTLRLDGIEIESRYEIWSVRQNSSDGESREVAIDGGEVDARRFQKAFGGQLLRRYGFSTVPVEVAEESDGDLVDALG